MSTPQTPIFIHSLEQQKDGRFTIVFDNGVVKSNAAFCCNGFTSKVDGDDYFEIYFERVNGYDNTSY